MVTIISWVRPSPRRRSGCHMTRSWSQPVKAQIATTTSAAEPEAHALLVDEEVAEDAAEA